MQYSFRPDKVRSLFTIVLIRGEPSQNQKERLNEVDRKDDPNYCPYHRYVDHPLEDCWVFQNWMQREYEAGRLALGEDALLNPPTQSKMVSTLHDLTVQEK